MLNPAGQCVGKSNRRFSLGTAERAGGGLASTQHSQRFGSVSPPLPSDPRPAPEFDLDLLGEAGEWRPTENNDVRLVLGHCSVGKLNQQFFLFFLHLRNRRKGTIEHADAGATPAQAMHVDATLIPSTEGPGESHNGKATSEHARGQHRGFSHADDGQIEQFTCAKKTRITKSRNNYGIYIPMPFRKHFQSDGAADLGFGARRDVGNAAGARSTEQ